MHSLVVPIYSKDINMTESYRGKVDIKVIT
jgi:hypothetical protein